MVSLDCLANQAGASPPSRPRADLSQVLTSALKAPQAGFPALVWKARGQEGGLAPADLLITSFPNSKVLFLA
jgi:hypothetical protein